MSIEKFTNRRAGHIESTCGRAAQAMDESRIVGSALADAVGEALEDASAKAGPAKAPSERRGGGWVARGGMLILVAVAVSRAAIPDAADDVMSPATAIPKSRAMTPDYHILMMRSVFSRDHNRARVVPRDLTATTQQTDPVPVNPSVAEANFVLKGVTIEDGFPTAFFEQTADQLTVRVRAGQTVSHGQISAITLDGINYQTREKLSRVVIGQTLDGGMPTGAATTQPSTDSLKPAAEHPAGDKPSWWRHSK